MLSGWRQQLDFLEPELDADVVGGAGLAEADTETVELGADLIGRHGAGESSRRPGWTWPKERLSLEVEAGRRIWRDAKVAGCGRVGGRAGCCRNSRVPWVPGRAAFAQPCGTGVSAPAMTRASEPATPAPSGPLQAVHVRHPPSDRAGGARPTAGIPRSRTASTGSRPATPFPFASGTRTSPSSIARRSSLARIAACSRSRAQHVETPGADDDRPGRECSQVRKQATPRPRGDLTPEDVMDRVVAIVVMFLASPSALRGETP